MNMYQHTISVCMLKQAQLTLIIFFPSRAIYLLRMGISGNGQFWNDYNWKWRDSAGGTVRPLTHSWFQYWHRKNASVFRRHHLLERWECGHLTSTWSGCCFCCLSLRSIRNSNDWNYIDAKKLVIVLGLLGFLAQQLIAQQENVQSMTMLQKNSGYITLVTICVNYVC